MNTYIRPQHHPDLLLVDTDGTTDHILGTQTLRLPVGIADNVHFVGGGIATEVDDDLVDGIDAGTVGLLLRAAWERGRSGKR